MSGGGSNTTVQKSDPWAGQQPYLRTGFEGAKDLLGQSTVAPYSAETEQGLGMMTDRALQGSPLIGMGQQQIADTLSGNYMSGGPGFDAFADAAWSSVRPSVDSMFATGGRSGSPLHAESLGRGFGRAMAPLYDAERNRMMGAAAAAPSLSMADYADAGQLMNVGAARDAKNQQLTDDQYNQLSRYMGLIQGNYGGTSTQTGGSGSNPILGALGGGLSGAGMASALGLSGPWGWGLAGLGALGGAFG